MNRREVLLIGSAAVLTVTIPLPVVGSSVQIFDYGVPIDRIELVNQAFNVLADYKFILPDKANLFGLNPYCFKDLEDLRNRVLTHVIDNGNRDRWSRAVYLTEIRRKLDERLGKDVVAHLKWMEGNEDLFTRKSLHRIMLDADIIELGNSVLILGGEIA